MKKTYHVPNMEAMQLQGEQILAGSGVTGSNGISYGGVDTEGALDPSVKSNTFDENPFE